MVKKLKKQSIDLVKAAVVTGVGAQVVTSAGGNAAGLQNVSKFYPAVGTVVGAGAVLRATRKLSRKRRKRR